MIEYVYPPVGPVNPVPAPNFMVFTPTTTPTQFDTAGARCVGVIIHVPDFDNTPAAVGAYCYVGDSAGDLGIEIPPGEKRFIACGNTNQLKVSRKANAGDAVAFIRIEVIGTNRG